MQQLLFIVLFAFLSLQIESKVPIDVPTAKPYKTSAPTSRKTITPSRKPTSKPTAKPSRKPSYKPIQVGYCPKNASVVISRDCAAGINCYKEPYGNCQCANCPEACVDVQVVKCKDGYICHRKPTPVFGFIDIPVCDADTVCETICPFIPPCFESCTHNESPCETYTKRYCFPLGAPCTLTPIETCSNVPAEKCNQGCTCDSERQVCDATSCCKCDPGFYSPRGNPPARCLPCPRGSASSSPGAVGGCPCLPGLYSASGLGPCFPRLCDPTVPGTLCG